MPSRYRAPGGWTVDVITLSGTPDKRDGPVAAGRLPGQVGEPGACRGQLISPDRDKDDVIYAAGIRHDGGFGVCSPPAEHIAGARPPAATSSVLGPWLSTQTVLPAAARCAP